MQASPCFPALLVRINLNGVEILRDLGPFITKLLSECIPQAVRLVGTHDHHALALRRQPAGCRRSHTRLADSAFSGINQNPHLRTPPLSAKNSTSRYPFSNLEPRIVLFTRVLGRGIVLW